MHLTFLIISAMIIGCCAFGLVIGTMILLPILQYKKLNDLWILSIGICLFILSFLLLSIFGWYSNYILLIFSSILLTMGFISFPAANSIVSCNLIENEQGIGFGVVFAVRSLSWAIAPYSFSMLYYLSQNINITQLIFFYAILFMIIALILIAIPLRIYINYAKINKKQYTFSKQSFVELQSESDMNNKNNNKKNNKIITTTTTTTNQSELNKLNDLSE